MKLYLRRTLVLSEHCSAMGATVSCAKCKRHCIGIAE